MLKKSILLSLISVWIICFTQAKERNLLSKSTTETELTKQLLPGTKWVSFPAYSEREAWNRIPEKYRKLIIQSGEDALDFEWGIVKATDFLEFERSGNRNISG